MPSTASLPASSASPGANRGGSEPSWSPSDIDVSLIASYDDAVQANGTLEAGVGVNGDEARLGAHAHRWGSCSYMSSARCALRERIMYDGKDARATLASTSDGSNSSSGGERGGDDGEDSTDTSISGGSSWCRSVIKDGYRRRLRFRRKTSGEVDRPCLRMVATPRDTDPIVTECYDGDKQGQDEANRDTSAARCTADQRDDLSSESASSRGVKRAAKHKQFSGRSSPHSCEAVEEGEGENDVSLPFVLRRRAVQPNPAQMKHTERVGWQHAREEGREEQVYTWHLPASLPQMVTDHSECMRALFANQEFQMRLVAALVPIPSQHVN